MTRQAGLLFRLRLLQLVRDPFCRLMVAVAFMLVLFSTCLGPLPSLGEGMGWRDMTLACGAFTGLAFALFILVDPSGGLVGAMPGLPLDLGRASFFVALAELAVLTAIVAPSMLFGFLVTPGPLAWADLLLLGLGLGQALAMCAAAGWVRLQVRDRGGAVLVLVLLWLLFSVPPLAWVDGRAILGSSRPGPGFCLAAFGIWLGATCLFLGLRSAKYTALRMESGNS